MAKVNLLFHLTFVQSRALNKLDSPDNEHTPSHLISPLTWFIFSIWANLSALICALFISDEAKLLASSVKFSNNISLLSLKQKYNHTYFNLIFPTDISFAWLNIGFTFTTAPCKYYHDITTHDGGGVNYDGFALVSKIRTVLCV